MIRKTILPLWVMVLMASCVSTPADTRVTLSGILENPPDSPVELNFFREYINNDRTVLTLEMDADGTFGLTFDVPGPVMATLSIARTNLPIYLEPGFALHIEGDASQPAGLMSEMQFSGNGSRENKFLFSYHTDMNIAGHRSLIREKAASLSPEAFMQFADSLAYAKTVYLESYDGSGMFSESFKTYIEAGILATRYQSLIDYVNMPRQQGKPDVIPSMPKDFFAFDDDPDLFDDDRLINIDYTGFLLSYLEHNRQTDGIVFPPDMSRHVVSYRLAGEYLRGHAKEYLKALSISREMNAGDLDTALVLFTEFRDMRPAEEVLRPLDSAYERIRALWAGNPAPGFTMTDMDGHEVSLADFHGKVVYMKFWASWCGPCMRQVPPAAELKKRLAGEEDLVFLYVSIDTDPEAWRTTVLHHDITGVHMRTPGRERGTPALYNVRWIPTFYIIGRDGRIFDHRPPKPADPEIDEVLKQALAESA